ncbi:MAG: hypothetical protein Q4F42_02825 [Rikenellaceae bacterium]|nr:hypothetical protein [Rikenellaceae bacterium]MDO5487397.1 hypothetical protein [Rikenellaceae bacterium]
MKTLFKIFLTVIAAVVALDGSAQNIAAKKSRLATGANGVTVVEQSEVSDAVRSVESRAKRTKVNGYTILILSDNSSRARENAVEAKDTFEENFPETEVKMYYETPSFYVTAGSYLTKEEAIIEMMRFRSVFPKAIAQNREMDITDFIIGNEEEQDE